MIELKTISTKPGCYLYKNSGKKIIYIGKAKNLKKRVNSYFMKDHADSPKTVELVKQIADVDLIVTDSEVEALLLESRLIKQYKPKYNVDLKHNERYAYLKLTDESYPRLITVRRKSGKGSYFGPFTSGYNRVLTLKTLNEVFELKTCKGNSKTQCFNSYIGLCACPDALGLSKSNYAKRVAKVTRCLKGHTQSVIAQLDTEMKDFAKQKHFEFAKQRRDQITALESLQERQKIETNKEFDQDIIGYSIGQDKIQYFVFQIEKGTINKREQFQITLPDGKDVQKAHQEFVMQFYARFAIPKQIVVADDFLSKTELELTAKALSAEMSYTVEFKIPKIGDTKQLLDLAIQNADIALAGENPTLIRLKEILKLPTIPFEMECYDISNLGDDYIVGAKIHFSNGEPNKSKYRKYRIKWQTKQNDFAAMHEVLKRRFYRVSIGEDVAPDLVIIDGGRGQLNAALDAMKEVGVRVPTISLAKQDEEILFPGLSRPLNTKRNKARDPAVNLLIRMRDEVHRFVISYHRKLRDG